MSDARYKFILPHHFIGTYNMQEGKYDVPSEEQCEATIRSCLSWAIKTDLITSNESDKILVNALKIAQQYVNKPSSFSTYAGSDYKILSIFLAYKKYLDAQLVLR